jgi:ATP-dependent Clp protease ATP-binding subunit ClpC
MSTLLKTRKIRAILKTPTEQNFEQNSSTDKSFLELFFPLNVVNKYSFLKSVFSDEFKNFLTNKLILSLNNHLAAKPIDEDLLTKMEGWINNKKNSKLEISAKEFNNSVRNILIKNEKDSKSFKTSYEQIKKEIKHQFPLIIAGLQNVAFVDSKKFVTTKIQEPNLSEWNYKHRIFVMLFALDHILRTLSINVVPLSENLKLPSSETDELIKRNTSDFFVGRDTEVNRIVQVLSRREKNNPILIGEKGIGKSRILEGLAGRILKNIKFNPLSTNRILSIDLELLVVNNLFKQQFEKRLKSILLTLKPTSQTILILDNIHVLFGVNAKETSLEIKNLLKATLSSNKIQCAGATTAEEFKQFIAKDKSLEAFFQPIIIKEPDTILTLQILKAIKKNYENYHSVIYNSKALKAAVTLSSQYITDRFLPDKAVDLLDEAGSYAKLKNFAIPSSAKIFYDELLEVKKQKIKAVNLENYELAKIYLKKELELETLVSGHIKAFYATKFLKPVTVSDNEITTIIASWTGIPVNKISKAESQNLLKMEEILHQRIIGQHAAVLAVSKAIRRARVGLKNPNRPIASFIFAGPTGVGKTELTKALAFSFFGSESNMVRLDMSEYMERHTVAKLIGSPPGYVGYNEGGQLTEAVRQKPYTVVLFDEMEKAHPDIFNLLLQILEDGHLTDSKGKKIDFKNTLIILTSNVGARVIENSYKNGSAFNNSFNDKTKSVYKKIWQLVNQELKNQFKPEFLNRLDEIIVFSQLTLDDITQIAEIMIKQLIKRVQKQNGITLIITDRAKHKVIKEGFNPIYGARPLRRAVMNLLEDNLATKFLTNDFTAAAKLIIDLDNNNKIQVAIKK